MKTFLAFLLALIVAPFVAAPHQEPDDPIIITVATADPFAEIPADYWDAEVDHPDPFAEIPTEWWTAEIATAQPIPPCRCGCMETGQCKCKNCCERTADPQWILDHHAYPIASSGRWVNYVTGKAKVDRERLPCIIFVTQDGCPPCKALEANFEQVDTTGYVCIKVNATRDPHIAAALFADQFPRLITYGEAGQLRVSVNGVQSADSIRAILLNRAPPPMFAPPPMYFAPLQRAVSFSRGGC